MIELAIKGCCKGCEHIDLLLRKFAGTYWIKCSHQEVCGKLEEEEQSGEFKERSRR